MAGRRDPESLKGNDRGFDTAAVYRSYDEYANDTERYFIEYFMRDVYKYYGYGFLYYDGAPVDRERVRELVEGFTTSNEYMRVSWQKNILQDVTVKKDGEPVCEELQEESKRDFLEQKMEGIKQRRTNIALSLLRDLHFVNKDGQPLRMMPRLELDPALLENPLYH